MILTPLSTAQREAGQLQTTEVELIISNLLWSLRTFINDFYFTGTVKQAHSVLSTFTENTDFLLYKDLKFPWTQHALCANLRHCITIYGY